jgi:hypothetical protein
MCVSAPRNVLQQFTYRCAFRRSDQLQFRQVDFGLDSGETQVKKAGKRKLVHFMRNFARHRCSSRFHLDATVDNCGVKLLLADNFSSPKHPQATDAETGAFANIVTVCMPRIL